MLHSIYMSFSKIQLLVVNIILVVVNYLQVWVYNKILEYMSIYQYKSYTNTRNNNISNKNDTKWKGWSVSKSTNFEKLFVGS